VPLFTLNFTITAGTSNTSSIYYFPQLGLGNGFQTVLTYVNYSPQTVSCQTNFIGDAGGTLALPFSDTGTVSSRNDTLSPGSSIHVETQVPASTSLSGWAIGTCSGPVKASLLYRYYSGATPQGEASVNASTAPTTEFVTFAQTQTGLAWANPSTQTANVTVTALNASGGKLGNTSFTVAPNAHGAGNIAPLLSLAGFNGSIQIASTVPIVTLSLNAEAFPVFSSLPAGDLPAGTALGESGGTPTAASGVYEYYFPQLGLGNGFQTVLTYVNYSPQTVSCQTNFIGDAGGTLTVPFSDTGAVSSRNDTLSPGSSIHVESQVPSSSSLSGWAIGTCTGPVKASLLYRYYSGTTPQGEASVNASTAPTTEFVTFAQTQTGLAWANPSAQTATVTVAAVSAAGVKLASTSFAVAPNAHGAANIAPLLNLASFTGSIQIASTVPIVTLSLNAEAFPVFSSLPAGDLPSGTILGLTP
jgi:hypothetical protein